MNQEHQAHNALVDTLHVLLGYSKRQLISDVLSAVLSIVTSIFFIVHFQYVLLAIIFLVLAGMMLTFALREYEFYKETKDVLKHLKIIEKE
jgi:asparagine N-glycosylation enzyme membrane subunit Stt3